MYVVIPARYASTRLPGKALVDLCGKPLIQWVYESACKSGAQHVVIATDNDRIQDAAKEFGAEVCMTSADHHSGTDRIAEVVEKLELPDDEIVVNLQGDEPLMPPVLLDQVADTLSTHSEAVMATVGNVIEDEQDYHDPHVVKLVTDSEGYALYFSRASIPWHRDALDEGNTPLTPGHRHIGLYAYRAGFIKEYSKWPPAPIEQAESLEQLRVLWHGRRIAVCEAAELPGPGVDTKDDLERVRKILCSN